MAIKDLPTVVLENDEFRVVAKNRTTQAPSLHAIHMVVDLNDDDDNRDCIDLYAEMKHTDSLGADSWSVCDMFIATNNILATQVRTAMRKSVITGHTKGQDTPAKKVKP